MDKLIVSSEEVASVAEVVPANLVAPKLPAAVPWVARILLAPLVFILPLLSFFTVIVWLVTRKREPRIRYGWMQYCCGLLVISGILTSIGGGLFFYLYSAPTSRPAVPFSLDGPVTLPSVPALATGESLSPRELATRVEDAVFIVSRESKWLKPTRETLSLVGFGTGVLLYAGDEESLFVTSRHVLDGESWERSKPYSGDAILWDRHGGSSRAQVVGRHKNLDLMLLRLPRSAPRARFVQTILTFEQIALGERIMVFGHPEGLFFSLSDGLVSRRDPAGEIQITAPVSPGASGGPVYDLHGRLLGVVKGMVDKRRSPHSENLNFAVRADSLLRPSEWQFDAAGGPALARFIAAAEARPESSQPPQ